MNRSFSYILWCALLLSSCGNQDADIPTENRISLFQDQQQEVTASHLTIMLPDPIQNTDWTQISGLPFNDIGNLSAVDALNNPKRIYIGDTKDGDLEATMQPVFSSGYGYFFTVDSELVALDLETKEIIWKKEINPHYDEDENPRGGGLAADSGFVFITTNSGLIAGFDGTTGKELWRLNNKVPFSAAPTLSAGMLYVIDRDNRLQAINARSGSPLWDYRSLPEPAAYSHVASASVFGPVIIAPFTSGEITAISADTKKPAWGQSIIGGGLNPGGIQFNTISSEVVISNRNVYASIPSGLTVALEGVSGKPIWQKEIGATKNILSVGAYLFLIDTHGMLYALSKETGDVIWRRQLEQYTDPEDRSGYIQWTSPIMSNGKILLFSNTDRALVVDAQNGDILQNIDDAPETIIDPAIADGKVYVHAKNGYVYIYED